MSDDKKAPLTDEQRRAVVNQMFKKTHEDMGIAIKLITATPTPDGFMVQTEAAGEIVVRMTRAMGALEKLIQMNTPPASDTVTTPTGIRPGVAKDGALVAGWDVERAPPDDGKPVMTPAAQAEAAAKLAAGSAAEQGSAIVGKIENMTVGVIQQTAARLTLPQAAGTEAN